MSAVGLNMTGLTGISIRPKDLAIVQVVLAASLPQDAAVYVFGSRAVGTIKRASDLDLAIDAGRPLTAKEALALADGFDQSNLPYRVDVVDMHNVSAAFKSIIDRDKILVR